MSGVVSPQVAALAPTIGREAELADLRLSFNSADTSPVVRVLVGMGGVGKTSLARAYAQRHLADYGVVWWVRAEDPGVIDAEFRALLEILLPPGEATQVSDARTVAFAHLAKQAEPWLLVLDNIPNPEAAQGLLPPTGHGHVLITSRSTGWPNPTTVRPLYLAAAVELLTAQSGDDDRSAAEALAEELGGLPLALAQAAGFARTNSVSLATYLRLYRERSAELHKDGRPADYPHTVSTTWQLAIGRLPDKTREMMNVLAFYAPDTIPAHLLFQRWDELTRHRAIGGLHAHSLSTPAGTDTITIHRLVQAVTRNRLHEELTSYEWADRARALIMAAMPQEPVTAVSLARWDTLRTHASALVDHLPPEHPDTLLVRSCMGYWIGRSGEAARAKALFAELVPIRERVSGAEHPDTLAARHDLAYWTGTARGHVQARDLFAELVPIRERVLGAEHPDTLTSRGCLARWTGRSGDPAAARDQLAEVLLIRIRVLDTEHPDTLTTRHELAGWTGIAGDPARARDLFTELLPVRTRVSGAEHPHTLATRYHLAFWTGEAGNAALARDLLADLLPIQERVLGADHYDTLRTRHQLARWTGKAGNTARACELFDELLTRCEAALGAEHVHTARARKDLAYWSEKMTTGHTAPAR